MRGKIGPHVEAYANFYACGEHLGEALFRVRKYANVISMNQCYLLEAAPLHETVPVESEQLAEDVFIARGLETFPAPKPNIPYVPPVGVVRRATDGLLEPDMAEHLFSADGPDEESFYTLRFKLGADRLQTVFFQLHDFFPEVNLVCISIRDYKGGESIEHWISSSHKNKSESISFFQQYVADTLENGYVELAIYCLEGEICLTVDEHKKMTLTTKDFKFFNFLCRLLVQTGIKQHDTFVEDEEVALWHYRPHQSLDHATFRNVLSEKGFQVVGMEQIL